ncbi:MAG: glycoside hydrolase [Acidobacteriia bacterium]|nr:glycoside hydrolase [Terriglobia bacterium]
MVLGTDDGNCGGSGEGFYSTRDGGSTWLGHSCISPRDYPFGLDIAYDLNNRVFAGAGDGDAILTLRYSDNNGVLWSRARVLGGSGLGGPGSPRLAIDASPSSPFKNSIYMSSIHDCCGEGGGATRVFVLHSSDGGQHWKSVPLDQWQLPSVDAFQRLSVGEDGIVYVTWMRCSRPQLGPCVKDGVPIYLSKSADGGMTWTPPSLVATTSLAPGNCLFGCIPNVGVTPIDNEPVITVVGSGGTARVYVVFYNWSGTQMQVEVVTSTDGGKTFGTPVRVSNSDVGDQFVPSISAAPDGTVAVSWLDRRNDPANLKYQPFLATSKDGQAFGTNFLLTSYQTDPTPFLGGGIPGPPPALWKGSAAYSTWTDDSFGDFRAKLGGVQF